LLDPSTTSANPNHKAIAIWLLVCCATIFGMIILGGVTRLTGSGLSMVEWAPILGILPPLNQAEWQETFLLYQQFPEYQLKNFNMSLADFKSIFWFEYGHRLLGRSIGLIFLLPFLFFLFRGKIEKALTPKLITLFVLGGLQGLMGWYMVKSGLVNDPHVSQYRLTINGSSNNTVADHNDKNADPENLNQKIGSLSLIITGIVIITILSGGFVAGTRAGFAFNTFPLMDGRLIPVGLFELSPLWRNFFENIVTVQFNHRVLATLLFIIIPVFWFKTGKLAGEFKLQPLARTGSHLLLAALVLQITLGISTLLLVVPVALAAAHQAGAIILLTAALFVSQQLHR